jgi:hypothetical protein
MSKVLTLAKVGQVVVRKILVSNQMNRNFMKGTLIKVTINLTVPIAKTMRSTTIEPTL